MKLAVLSDIHANLEAFQEVLADLKSQTVDLILTLGDAIGYGPDPAEVIYLLQENRILSVMGNHERAVADPKNLNWFNPTARKALEITTKMLSSESIDYISKFPNAMVHFGARFVHGFPPESQTTYLFQVTDRKMNRAFQAMTEKFCFVGHTHDLELIAHDGHRFERTRLIKGFNRFKPNMKYIVNIGSVGQPRDGNTDAKYIIFDTDNKRIELRHVPYDRSKTAAKIVRAGIPRLYAEKLL